MEHLEELYDVDNLSDFILKTEIDRQYNLVKFSDDERDKLLLILIKDYIKRQQDSQCENQTSK